MRQRRGEKLTVGDMNEALKWSGANVNFLQIHSSKVKNNFKVFLETSRTSKSRTAAVAFFERIEPFRAE